MSVRRDMVKLTANAVNVANKYGRDGWTSLCLEYILNEEFIRENNDKVNWIFISSHQDLSEDFIREFQDRVNWTCISRDQKLSNEFILEFKDKICFDYLLSNSEVSHFCSKEIQNLILQELLDEIKNYTEFYDKYMTTYMKEQFEKLRIML
jgi:hypothetical protein